MIDLRRAKMGLPPISNPASRVATPAAVPPINGSGNHHRLVTGTTAPINNIMSANGSVTPQGPGSSTARHMMVNSSMTPSTSNSYHPTNGTSTTTTTTAHATATAALQSEDERLRCFLHLLSNTSNSSTTSNSTSTSVDPPPSHHPPLNHTSSANTNKRRTPTVPMALTRRILHTQGAGYLDQTVPALLSGAADRFLATVLQQSLTCRDRRLDGEVLAKKERRELRRVTKRIRAATLERRRREREAEARLKAKVIGSGAGNVKGRIIAPQGGQVGGNNNNNNNNSNEEEDSDILLHHDSVDEEENYYENFFGGEGLDQEVVMEDGNESYDEDEDDNDDEEEDEDDMLLLRDIVRPLQAWGVNVTGTIGLDTDDSFNEAAVSETTDMAVDDDVMLDGSEDQEAAFDDGEDDEDNTSITGMNSSKRTKTPTMDRDGEGSNNNSPKADKKDAKAKS